MQDRGFGLGEPGEGGVGGEGLPEVDGGAGLEFVYDPERPRLTTSDVGFAETTDPGKNAMRMSAMMVTMPNEWTAIGVAILIRL